MQVEQAEIAILSLYLASLHSVKAATSQVLSTRHCRTMVPQVVTLIAGSKCQFVDIGRWRQNVYNKKSQRYAKDNRTAFNCMQ